MFATSKIGFHYYRWLLRLCSKKEKCHMRKFLKSAYGRLYANLPQRAKVMASKLAFELSGPQVYRDRTRHPTDGLARGAVTFSIDFEMAWAWQYAKSLDEDCVTISLRERAQVPQMLSKFDEFDIAVTWATVGHLFLENCCRDTHSMAHPDLPRPDHFESRYLKFTDGDWYQNDPCSDVASAPAWYAPDLIRQILAAKTKHEMACHGFSHASFAHCSPKVAAAELDACLEAMKPFGLRPISWVFPTNEVGNLDVLVDKGFKIVRYFPGVSGVISLPIQRDDGLWAVHDSSGIEVGGDAWNMGERLQRLTRFVDKAAETRMAVHFWFHPSMQTEQMQSLLFPLLRYCAEQREKGLIDVLTMEQLVSATEAALR